MQKKIITLLCAAGMIISTPTMAQTLRIKPTAPQHYTVKQGDTLWGISGKYLYRPWKWHALWQVNRNKIHNPHLIYPGQVLTLKYVNGRPYLGVSGGIPTIKLSPRIRDLGSGYAINSIDVNFYGMFMKHPQFVTKTQLDRAARVVDGPESRIMFTVGDRIYADGINESGEYLVFRVKHKLKDPKNPQSEQLGYLVEFVGEVATLDTPNSALSHRSSAAKATLARNEYFAQTEEKYFTQTQTKSVVARTAQPLMVTEAVSEIAQGDYLMRKPKDLNSFHMMPHEPARAIEADIVEIMDGVSESGAMQTIILNKGQVDGLEKGTVLGIYKRGRLIKDDKTAQELNAPKKYLNTPNEEIALAMVYRVGEHVSSAIILENITNVNKDDLVAEPGRDLDTFGISEMKKQKPIMQY